MECVICKYVDNWPQPSTMSNCSLNAVKKKGIANMCQISRKVFNRGLHRHIENEESIYVHAKCHVRYIKSNITVDSKKRRLTDSSVSSSEESETASYEFDFKKHCVVCAKRVDKQKKSFSTLLTNSAKQLVIDYHSNNDTLDPEIKKIIVGKLLCEDDLNILDAKYHRKTCSAKLTIINHPLKKDSEISNKIKISMEEIFNYIDDNEDNQFTVEDFHSILNEKKNAFTE